MQLNIFKKIIIPPPPCCLFPWLTTWQMTVGLDNHNFREVKASNAVVLNQIEQGISNFFFLNTQITSEAPPHAPHSRSDLLTARAFTAEPRIAQGHWQRCKCFVLLRQTSKLGYKLHCTGLLDGYCHDIYSFLTFIKSRYTLDRNCNAGV
jgi:hypothetical protein